MIVIRVESCSPTEKNNGMPQEWAYQSINIFLPAVVLIVIIILLIWWSSYQDLWERAAATQSLMWLSTSTSRIVSRIFRDLLLVGQWSPFRMLCARGAWFSLNLSLCSP
ncbi:unnamed protein product [Amoebophrya sp. A25]|nr:unnamed protein product [Amoebophrya sp. A25]|eukprot:GSA25T00015150001.1